MAKAARGKTAPKRTGSAVTKAVPSKANPKSKANNRKPWTAADLRMLRQLAKANTPTSVISQKMGRTEIAIRGKAQREGISLGTPGRSRGAGKGAAQRTARAPAARGRKTAAGKSARGRTAARR